MSDTKTNIFAILLKQAFVTDSPYSNWTVVYQKDRDKARNYTVTVEVSRYFIVWISCASKEYTYSVGETLSGELTIYQNGRKVPDGNPRYVSNKEPVTHNVIMDKNDMTFVNQAAYLQTFWFPYVCNNSEFHFWVIMIWKNSVDARI